jgi:hypothetical protein
MADSVSHQSFPHLWKKLWKTLGNRRRAVIYDGRIGVSGRSMAEGA